MRGQNCDRPSQSDIIPGLDICYQTTGQEEAPLFGKHWRSKRVTCVGGIKRPYRVGSPVYTHSKNAKGKQTPGRQHPETVSSRPALARLRAAQTRNPRAFPTAYHVSDARRHISRLLTTLCFVGRYSVLFSIYRALSCLAVVIALPVYVFRR